MFGPVLTREVVTAARRRRLYVLRAAYPAGLLLLLATAWLVYTGPRLVRGAGDVARFGSLAFELLWSVQLVLATFFSALFTAGAVAQEKDKGTLELLLLTHLSNRELVLGKLLASLLYLGTMFVAALPVFMLLPLLGGVSYGQIARVFAISAGAILAAGSLGSTIALWRDKTFHTLAIAGMAIVAWFGAGEIVARATSGDAMAQSQLVAAASSPWRAAVVAARPYAEQDANLAAAASLAGSLLAAVCLNAISIWKIRQWNPVRDAKPRRTKPTKSAAPRAPRQTARAVWDRAIAWREMRTWAYGRRIVWVRTAYVVLCAAAAYAMLGQSEPVVAGLWLPPLAGTSLMLVNALAVVTISSERDSRALDLLLVTELSPKEIVFGKLAGALYNAREMVLVPLLLCVALAAIGRASWENVAYLVVALALLNVFAAVLGLHCGMIYASSRTAILASLGTLFFLLVGVATCIAILVAFSGPAGSAFEVQLGPFLALMVGGSAGLYFALGAKSPSAAIGWAALVCPFATFWAITSYFLDYSLGIFLVTIATYAFATLAMLIPAIAEFDAIIGRTTGECGG